MMFQKPKTAILFFARSAKIEHKEKRMQLSTRGSRKLFNLFSTTTHDKAQSTGIPVYKWCEHKQVGSSFGDRLSHAIAAIFNKGFGNIVIIGNDCPELSKADLIRAEADLQNGRAVIGPDKDGGSYLIGISRGVFDAKAFASLPWQQSSLLEAIVDYFENQEVSISLLAAKRDVDTYDALKKVATGGQVFQQLRKTLLSFLILDWIQKFNITSCLLAEPHFPAYSLRGPPER